MPFSLDGSLILRLKNVTRKNKWNLKFSNALTNDHLPCRKFVLSQVESQGLDWPFAQDQGEHIKL